MPIEIRIGEIKPLDPKDVLQLTNVRQEIALELQTILRSSASPIPSRTGTLRKSTSVALRGEIVQILWRVRYARYRFRDLSKALEETLDRAQERVEQRLRR